MKRYVVGAVLALALLGCSGADDTDEPKGSGPSACEVRGVDDCKALEDRVVDKYADYARCIVDEPESNEYKCEEELHGSTLVP